MNRCLNEIAAGIVLLLCLFLMACNSNEYHQLDLTQTGDSLEIFGAGFVSTGMYERDIAISESGTEIIYTLGNYKQNQRYLVSTKKHSDGWSTPELLNISGKYQDIEPFLSEGGQRLFFASNRPLTGKTSSGDYNIWYCDRNESLWDEPVPLGINVNSDNDEFYPSVARSGNLYFTGTRASGVGKEDIYLSMWQDGAYQAPITLDTNVNSPFYEFNAYISPQEDLLIFTSYGRPDGFGGGDLYFSQKLEDGKWSPSKNLGPAINSSFLDYCPFIDFPNRKFYFTSERMGAQSEASSLDAFRSSTNTHGNGMGDIYSIDLDRLGLDL